MNAMGINILTEQKKLAINIIGILLCSMDKIFMRVFVRHVQNIALLVVIIDYYVLNVHMKKIDILILIIIIIHFLD